MGGILAARRRKPQEDLISALAQAELDGEHLSDEEIFSFLRLLLPAGVETTFRSTGNLLYLLLSDPDQLEAVRTNRALMPQAIEEAIRLEAPLLNIHADGDEGHRDRWRGSTREIDGDADAGRHEPGREQVGRSGPVRHRPA